MAQTAVNSLPLDDFDSIEDLVQQYPTKLTTHTLRYYLRDRDKNGLGKCCMRLGRRVLISRTLFAGWLASRVGG